MGLLTLTASPSPSPAGRLSASHISPPHGSQACSSSQCPRRSFTPRSSTSTGDFSTLEWTLKEQTHRLSAVSSLEVLYYLCFDLTNTAEGEMGQAGRRSPGPRRGLRLTPTCSSIFKKAFHKWDVYRGILYTTIQTYYLLPFVHHIVNPFMGGL